MKGLCLRLLMRAVFSLRLMIPSARPETGVFFPFILFPLFLPPFLSVTLLLWLKERRKYLSNLTQRCKLLQVQGLERDCPPVLPYLLLSFGGATHIMADSLCSLQTFPYFTGPENETASHTWTSRTSMVHCHLLPLPSGCCFLAAIFRAPQRRLIITHKPFL